ncbi:MAG: nucleotidyltransferase domain-containing protein [Candidatus Pacearchaeota archaeon]|nr:nucleotidyltransferase domain-containing protein [Candidatus Pacearchaeota archaeon]
MYDNTELKVLEQIYLKSGIHKRELSKQIKIGMPSVEYALEKIKSLLKKQKSGNQLRYFINYSKGDLTPMLYAVEYSRLNELPLKIKLSVREFLKELKEKPLLVIVFGSYARGDYTDKSDIDILLVFQRVTNEKHIENMAKKVSMRTNTKINPIYLDYDVFKKSFHDSTKEFFRNLKKNKIILTGIEWWRQLEDEET